MMGFLEKETTWEFYTCSWLFYHILDRFTFFLSNNVHVMIFVGSDPPSFSYQLRHRRGKSETTRAQYINTKDVRCVYCFCTLAMLS